jgi:hypothetical protein
MRFQEDWIAQDRTTQDLKMASLPRTKGGYPFHPTIVTNLYPCMSSYILNHCCIQSLQEERRTAIGEQPMFPGFNDIHFSDKADNFEDGRIKTDDPDPLDQMTLRNQVQLSTYGNCIGKNLKDLTNFMNEHLRGEGLGAYHQGVLLC